MLDGSPSNTIGNRATLTSAKRSATLHPALQHWLLFSFLPRSRGKRTEIASDIRADTVRNVRESADPSGNQAFVSFSGYL